MNEVNKTLYIPLYGKAYVSRRGLILNDRIAEDIWSKESFPLKGKSRSKWLAFYMGMRSAVFDKWTIEQIAHAENAVIIHIGCGMDSRAFRINTPVRKWYDVDFEEVIRERKRYYPETESYRMIAADVREDGWLSSIPEKNRAIIVMEGVSMYLSRDELNGLLRALSAHFKEISILMDCYTELAAKLSSFRNPINDVGVRNVYGLDDPEILENENFSFVKEHDMTPSALIDELSGAEKHIFRKLYAGKMSKKLYRLYEFKSR